MYWILFSFEPASVIILTRKEALLLFLSTLLLLLLAIIPSVLKKDRNGNGDAFLSVT